jgi:hypothetical protein
MTLKQIIFETMVYRTIIVWKMLFRSSVIGTKVLPPCHVSLETRYPKIEINLTR